MMKLRVSPTGTQPQRLTVVAVSEDSSTDARVHEFCRSLARQLGPGRELVKHMWLLSELRIARLCAIAADEAAGSELIIVSLHHGETLPMEVKTWIELWVGQKGEQLRVLLALFDPLYRGVSSSMQAYLREVARKANIEFLAQTEEMPDDLA